MTVPHKIQVKLAGHEFFAEGEKDTVKEQYEMFLEAIQSLQAQPAQAPKPPGPPAQTTGGNGNGGAGGLDRETLNRIFLVDSDGQVSLRMLPQSQQREADGVLLLIYGFRALAGQMDVLSGRLLAAAQTSGLNIDRIDRAVQPYMELISKGGLRSGSRWGLRNTGVNRAEEIIREML